MLPPPPVAVSCRDGGGTTCVDTGRNAVLGVARGGMSGTEGLPAPAALEPADGGGAMAVTIGGCTCCSLWCEDAALTTDRAEGRPLRGVPWEPTLPATCTLGGRGSGTSPKPPGPLWTLWTLWALCKLCILPADWSVALEATWRSVGVVAARDGWSPIVAALPLPPSMTNSSFSRMGGWARPPGDRGCCITQAQDDTPQVSDVHTQTQTQTQPQHTQPQLHTATQTQHTAHTQSAPQSKHFIVR